MPTSSACVVDVPEQCYEKRSEEESERDMANRGVNSGHTEMGKDNCRKELKQMLRVCVKSNIQCTCFLLWSS